MDSNCLLALLFTDYLRLAKDISVRIKPASVPIRVVLIEHSLRDKSSIRDTLSVELRILSPLTRKRCSTNSIRQLCGAASYRMVWQTDSFHTFNFYRNSWSWVCAYNDLSFQFTIGTVPQKFLFYRCLPSLNLGWLQKSQHRHVGIVALTIGWAEKCL